MNHPTNPQAWSEANKKAAWRETRLPLQGLYPCLTMQANVTLHQATGLAKYVMVLREPTDHVELYRSFRELDPWREVAVPARTAFEEMLGNMSQMMGLESGLYQ